MDHLESGSSEFTGRRSCAPNKASVIGANCSSIRFWETSMLDIIILRIENN